MKTFSLRFDIDSLADIEVGVPRLLTLARDLEVRFTFFVNMGKSFNRRILWSRFRRGGAGATRRSSRHRTTIHKLGLWRTVRTVLLNPDIGLSHQRTLCRLLDDTHELGLHGGMDHPLWQWKLEGMSKEELAALLTPAYEQFTSLYGKPKGFASPGFRCDRKVLELVDAFGFAYASDMEGERPFRIQGFRHVQIPVNIIGPDKVPLLEHLGRTGRGEAEHRVETEIARHEHAVLYGHPACEGTDARLKEIIFRALKRGRRIVTLDELSVRCAEDGCTRTRLRTDTTRS